MREEFFTVAEVAALCRVTPRMVQKWCKEGTIQAVRLDRTYRIARSAYDAWRGNLQLERPVIDVGCGRCELKIMPWPEAEV